MDYWKIQNLDMSSNSSNDIDSIMKYYSTVSFFFTAGQVQIF